MTLEKNMISDSHFSQLAKANQRLTKNRNVLTKMRANRTASLAMTLFVVAQFIAPLIFRN